MYKFSEGIPRRINLIFSRLLLHCAVEQRHRVTVADVREVIQELQGEKLASGDSFAESDFQEEDVFDEVVPVGDEAGDKPVPVRQEEENQQRRVGDLTQRRAASSTGQLAAAPDSRRSPAQNPAPGTASNRTPKAALREVKKKSPTRPAVKADREPGRQADSSSPPQRKKFRSGWGVVLDWSILITCSCRKKDTL